MKVSGKVIDENGNPKSETEVELSTGNWKTLTMTKENGSFSFPGVPMRNDWLLTATEGLITDDEEPCVPEPAPGPACPQPPQKRAFAFVTPDKSEYTLILKDPKLKGSYEIIKSEKKNSNLKVLIHCFTGSKDFAKKLIDLNCYISVSGIITFKNSSELDDTISSIPIENLLVETDSPYLAPMPYRGKDNEPSCPYLDRYSTGPAQRP